MSAPGRGALGLALGLAALAAACAREPEPAGGGSSGVVEGSAGPELGPVVAGAIAALEARVGTEDPPPPAPDEATVEAAREPALGLVEALATTPERESMRRVMLEELVGHGDALVPHLEALLFDREAEPDQRRVAAEALGALDSLAATEPLLAFVESARTEVEPEHWLIAQCAWRLADTTQDWILPRVLEALRYETDHETVLWLADAAARFGNYAGLEGLRVIMESGSATAARAAGLRARLTADFPSPEAAEVAWAERGEVGQTWRHEPSARLELETWRLIGSLAEWQLRGVDDARFVLSRSAPYAADFLGRALSDEDVYVRVHSAQCLERMGGRGRAALGALVAALDDPRVAPTAAAALGGLAVQDQGAAAALVERLGPEHDLELRVAAARALGALAGAGPDTAPLAALVGDEGQPLELRAAAAGALVRIAPLERTAESEALLRELADSPAVEVTEVRAALDALAARRSPAGQADAPADPAEEDTAADGPGAGG